MIFVPNVEDYSVEDDDLTLTSLQHFFLEFLPLVSEPLLQVTFASSAPDHRESEVDELIIAIQYCAT